MRRCWKTGLANGACAAVSTSVSYERGARDQGGDSEATVLACHYLIQPGGAGTSSLIHVAQIDYGLVGHSTSRELHRK